jgi:hypothetical protein
MPDAMDVLRREVEFVDAHCCAPMLKAIRRVVDRPGSLIVVLIDEDRRLVDLVIIEDGADQMVYAVEKLVDADLADVAAMVLVTDRTGEVPADRPDDRLVWMELVALAETGGITLLDWFVVWGRYAFSPAEFAPVPAQW